ncbi:hypothetical protein K9N50_09605 [bacterium]|nr:hypothetical protein [bacterium]
MKLRVKSFLFIFIITIFATQPNAFAENEVKIEGKGYFYYMHDASKGDGQSNSFDFSRMYIGAKYKLSDEFTVRYLTDMGHKDKTGQFEIFSKYAYVDWKIRNDLNLIMGLQGTNNWKQPEDAWYYRSIQYAPMEMFGKYWGDRAKEYSGYLEKWIEDPAISTADSMKLIYKLKNFSTAGRYKMGSSADLGVTAKYKPTDITYVNLMMLNGSGYKAAEDDMYKNIQIRAGIYLLEKTVHVSGYFEAEPWRSVDETGSEKSYMNTQMDAMVSYTQKDKFTIGFDSNVKTFSGIQEISASCISAFGNVYLLPERLKVLARYDNYITGLNDAEVKSGDSKLKSDGGLIIVGLDYKASDKISIIPNFQIMTYEDSKKDPVNTAYVHLQFNL